MSLVEYVKNSVGVKLVTACMLLILYENCPSIL